MMIIIITMSFVANELDCAVSHLFIAAIYKEYTF